ncbi:aminotransferase class V-fold PLP-dependent enzyme [Spartinivicinus poritis]|uniref:Aminotransferase class V-fold PLP-dependent enzyme n=1 Tax=Spartinivicinus poritis TaxID=2994640 RepID=A0ABT5UGA4_9GAMM|nr:aminotransferase class V-fold PLP-dependent enzyme [Spartinivicinus sp. A2-2]MDE1464517.1 aminotransferase class V-fold PLP-dependent enzyme [Spartinivicinus sp. A2-2]
MSQWHAEFPLNPDIYYLNHAAVAPWPARAAQAVEAFAQENIQQGASQYPNWLAIEQQLKDRLAKLINAADWQDIALLKNTSEALSVVAYGIAWQPGDNVVISDQEFPSNRIVWESLANQGVTVKQVDISGSHPEQALIEACDPQTRLLSISSVQYASGLKLDLTQLGNHCQQAGILYCVDAIQSIGAVQFDASAIKADFVMADGHKWMLGPEGLALFYSTPQARAKLSLKQFGWHMVEVQGNYDTLDWEIAQSARRFECGSPNMLGAYALNASIGLLLEVGMANVEQQLLDNINWLQQQLAQLNNVQVISTTETNRYAGIVTFRVHNQEMAELHRHLMDKGVICAYRGGGIRLSPHFYTSKQVLEESLQIIAEAIG